MKAFSAEKKSSKPKVQPKAESPVEGEGVLAGVDGQSLAGKPPSMEEEVLATEEPVAYELAPEPQPETVVTGKKGGKVGALLHLPQYT